MESGVSNFSSIFFTLSALKKEAVQGKLQNNDNIGCLTVFCAKYFTCDMNKVVAGSIFSYKFLFKNSF
jgi:hypothetical protein